MNDNERLLKLAQEILAKNGNDEAKARQPFVRKLAADRKLLNVAVLFYLAHVKKLGSGQPPFETQSNGAASEPSDAHNNIETHKFDGVVSEEGVGQTSDETQVAGAHPDPDKPITVKAHNRNVKKFWRHPPRSQEQKEIARMATMLGSSAWQAYGIERLKYREAEAFIAGEGQLGAQAARASTEHVEKAVFVWQALNHIKGRMVVSDDSVTLMSLVDQKDATQFWLQAKQRAPQIVADKLVPGMQRAIDEEIRQIAAA